jgi:signal transduction histidine kinase
VDSVKTDVTGAIAMVDAVSQRRQRDDREGALRIVDARALPLIERASDGLGRLIQFNEHEAQEAADRILATGRPRGLWPEITGVIFAIIAAYCGIRLLRQYLRWAAERSSELEQFAGRVAHDIRSPLGSASLALELAQQEPGIDPRTRALLARVRGTMERMAKLVDGLLVFASSGGYIIPGMFGATRTSTGRSCEAWWRT